MSLQCITWLSTAVKHTDSTDQHCPSDASTLWLTTTESPSHQAQEAEFVSTYISLVTCSRWELSPQGFNYDFYNNLQKKFSENNLKCHNIQSFLCKPVSILLLPHITSSLVTSSTPVSQQLALWYMEHQHTLPAAQWQTETRLQNRHFVRNWCNSVFVYSKPFIQMYNILSDFTLKAFNLLNLFFNFGTL